MGAGLKVPIHPLRLYLASKFSLFSHVIKSGVGGVPSGIEGGGVGGWEFVKCDDRRAKLYIQRSFVAFRSTAV